VTVSPPFLDVGQYPFVHPRPYGIPGDVLFLVEQIVELRQIESFKLSH
jgi:hypothetical protein